MKRVSLSIFCTGPDSHSGIFRIANNPLLIVSYPVVEANNNVSPGIMLMGRLLDSTALDRLARMTQMTLTLGDLQDPAIATDAGRLPVPSWVGVPMLPPPVPG